VITLYYQVHRQVRTLPSTQIYYQILGRVREQIRKQTSDLLREQVYEQVLKSKRFNPIIQAGIVTEKAHSIIPNINYLKI
jgi:hypothetical protein